MFALDPEPAPSRRIRPLAAAVLLGTTLHCGALAAMWTLDAPVLARPRTERIQMRLNVSEPRESPIPTPDAPPPQPQPQPQAEVPSLAQTKPRPTKPAEHELPAADVPASPPPLIVGLTLSSTTVQGKGGRYAIGNTALGAPDRVAKTPMPQPLVQPALAPATETRARGAASKTATEAKMLRAVSPVYPAQAKREGIEGVVVVAVTIDAAGHVESVTVLRGLGFGLDESAMRAVRETAWAPGSLDGRAVRTTRRLNIRFSLQS